MHLCTKRFANVGDTVTAGVQVNPNNYTDFTFPVMTSRSNSNADLVIQSITEWMWSQNFDGGGPDAQGVAVSTFVSFNGAAFTFVATNEVAGVTTAPTRRTGGGSLFVSHRVGGLPQGQTFRVRLRFALGGAVPSAYLRSFDLTVQESVFEIYEAA